MAKKQRKWWKVLLWIFGFPFIMMFYIMKFLFILLLAIFFIEGISGNKKW